MANTNTGFNFVHLNCRSLYKKLDQISHLYSNYDIICCTETWLDKSHTSSMLIIPNMTMYRLDRQNKRGGGVCIYVAMKWAKYVNQLDLFSLTLPDIEIITVSISKPVFRKLLISCVYRPPNSKVDICHDKIKDLICHSERIDSELWVLGDLNIDYLIRDKPDVKKFITTFRSYGLNQLITDITRPFKNSGTCIDWIITSSPFVLNSGVDIHLISDHLPVYCTRKKKREHYKTESVDARDYAKYNVENLRYLLGETNWDAYDASNDPNEMYVILLERLYSILSIMCPLRRFKQRVPSVNWINRDIYKAIRTRKFYVSLFKLTRRNEHLRLSHIWRNKVNSMIDKAKSTYIKSQLDRHTKNPKKFWRLINSFLDNRTVSLGDITFKDTITGENIIKGSEASFLNNYFVNIATRLGLDANTDYGADNLPLYDIQDILSFETIEIGADETLRLAKDIDISKASCILNINKFSRLFTTSLMYGVFPRSWATGFVNVIPKVGDLNEPSNWRPITQTNIYAKTLEKIVHKRLLAHVLDNNILSKYQFGFLPGKSTQLAVFDLLKHVYSSLNNKKIFGAACLDISKAFDCINHDLLISKLRKMGVSDMTINWFKSYLDRTQQLTFNEITSECISVRSGIGQGTIVGPLIFLLYINDIVLSLPNVHINMYADDCILYSTGNSWDQVRARLQIGLNGFDEWCRNNSLVLNISKSKCLLVASRSKLSKINYDVRLSVRNTTLDFVKKFLYLGVYLDSEMTLQSLISHVKKIVTSKVKTLYRIRRYITTKCAISIYKQTILPLFDYAGFLLISCNKKDRGDLQIIQNNCLRMCYNVRLLDRLSLIELHREANLVSLEQRRHIQLLCLMYIYKKFVNVERVFARNTRQGCRYNFRLDNHQSTKYKNSPYFKGTVLWDRLPDTTIALGSLLEFKREIRKCFCPFNESLL